MINLYWPVYKNIEKELIELSNQVHFDDGQLSIYSVKISELLIRCSVEIEAISKDLFLSHGGTEPSEGDLYFDTDCLQLLEDRWLLSKKKLIVSAPNFYFQNTENKILSPLLKANKRGDSGSDWKKAYQAVKHNRTLNLKKGNIKNLLRALGALFILNLYYKSEVFNFEKDHLATTFPINMGSDIFAIKLHKWVGYDGNHNYQKAEDIEECIYLIKYTDDSLEKSRKVTEETLKEQNDILNKHPKILKYLETNKIEDYKGQNLAWDVLGKEDYIQFLRSTTQKQIGVFKDTEYEGVINNNNI